MPSRGRLATLCVSLFVLLVAPASVLAQTPPQLTSAVSRKSHGGTNYDIALPLTGNSGIESRRVSSLGMRLVLTFDQPIVSMNAPAITGTGIPAAPASVRPQPPPQLTSAVSRKSHGGTNYDIALPLTGNSGIESRRVSSLGMRLVLTFDQPIVSMNAPAITGTGIPAAPAIVGNI